MARNRMQSTTITSACSGYVGMNRNSALSGRIRRREGGRHAGRPECACATRETAASPPRVTKTMLLTLAILMSLSLPTVALQLSMVATHGTTRSRRSKMTKATSSSPSAARRTNAAPFSPLSQPPTLPTFPGVGDINNINGNNGGITSSLISNLAIVALKLRLAEQASVECDVTASSSDLLWKGTVGPVTVRGKRWSSPLGLTCRAIEATVQRCHLDMASAISRRKLVLTTPAEGSAMIALNGADFANFIKHPLMKPPAISSGHSLSFMEGGVAIDSADGGTVNFAVRYMDRTWGCKLKRREVVESRGDDNGRKAIVSVIPLVSGRDNADVNDPLDECEIAARLGDVLTDFFNDMVFELDGTYLSFRDMMVTAKGGTPSVMLNLSIKVRKFPSPGLAF